MEELGKGTFGVVTKAKQKKTDKLVALKKFIVHDRKDGFPITSFREITIMRKLHHINVLQLVSMVHERLNNEKAIGFFYTVTPYICSDLNGLLNNTHIRMTLPQIKCIVKQALQGMDYVHSQNYLHRDIKTANILLDYFGVVKLADFGLARVYHGPPPNAADSAPGGGKYEYTGLVVTRWYRPPELLLGERKYTTAVDMWGMGCVLGEMYTRHPILEGSSDLDQADRIFRLVGAPTEENFPHYRDFNRNKVNTDVHYTRTLEQVYGKKLDPSAISLLSGLLLLDPQKRFNAKKALESDYFTASPLPCEPQDLPKFEDSHESDVKRYKREPQEASWTSKQKRRKRGPPPPSSSSSAPAPAQRRGPAPIAGDVPSSNAHGSDLYGATDTSFSAMKKYLHHDGKK